MTRRITPTHLVAGGAIVVAIGIAAFFAGRGRGSPDATEPTAARDSAPTAASAHDPTTVTLYYIAEGGLSLVAQQEELALNDQRGLEARAQLVVERQLAPAPAPLASPFPEGTRLRGLYLTPGGDAFVDLSQDVTRGHPGGSLDELFTVYAIVNALTTNVPEITAVQILIGGREVDTLAGHVDLRQPLGRDMKWVS